VDAHDLLVLDLDGVVYVGAGAVPAAVETLLEARSRGIGWCFATNNASRTPHDVAAHLVELGLPAADDEVITSSQAAAQIVADRCGGGAVVLAVGGPGVAAACAEAGLRPVTSLERRGADGEALEEHPVAVVQGFGRDVAWTDLAQAARAVRGGALWVATNTDATLPTGYGPAPGNGTLVAAVRAAVDLDPVVAGKPEPVMFAQAAARVGALRPLVVGDRLDTDLAGAVRAGMPGLLVLTGVSRPADLLAAPAAHRPTYVARDLTSLLQAHPATERSGDGWRCGTAVVRVRDGELRGEAPSGPTGSLDLLRAACAAVWSREPGAPVPSVGPELERRWEALADGGTRGVVAAGR
jgi:HAD superfamily hydrolase (TIGR01450 family)